MSSQKQGETCYTRCMLLTLSAVMFIVFVVIFIDAKKIRPIPSVSLLSLNGTAVAVNITAGRTSFPTQNLTAVFSISSRNKVPAIYSDFRVRGSQLDVTNIKKRSEFFTASVASVQSLEQSGESRDTVSFSLPNATVNIESWAIVQNKDNETIRTGIARVTLRPSLSGRYTGKRRTISMQFFCGSLYRSSNGNTLLAKIVVNSRNHSPELSFTNDVFDCGLLSPCPCLWLAYFYLAVSIIFGLTFALCYFYKPCSVL